MERTADLQGALTQMVWGASVLQGVLGERQHSEAVRGGGTRKGAQDRVGGRQVWEGGSLWWELREEGSGTQTGPEGKARIGVTLAEAELGYSRKQTGEPRPDLQALRGPRRAKGALFWAVRVRAGQWEALPLALGNQLFKAGPGLALSWAQILRRDVVGCQRQRCGSQPPFCPIWEPQSSFNGVKTLVLPPTPPPPPAPLPGGCDTWTGAQTSAIPFKDQPQLLQIRTVQVGLCPCISHGDPTIPTLNPSPHNPPSKPSFWATALSPTF